MIIGTSYFVSVESAKAYYRGYHYENVSAAVQRKIVEGEIHIGKPQIKEGEKLITIDNGRRYAVETGAK